jgi:hypothetical protein
MNPARRASEMAGRIKSMRLPGLKRSAIVLAIVVNLLTCLSAEAITTRAVKPIVVV